MPDKADRWCNPALRPARFRLTALCSAVTLALAGLTVAAEPVSGGQPSAAAGPEQQTDAPALARGRALMAAHASGTPVEVPELTTETSRVWALPNGHLRAEITAGPARVNRDGKWSEVDLDLVRRPDGTVAAKVHPFDLVLAGSGPAADRDVAAVGSGSSRLSLAWSKALPEPVLEGTKATYPEVYPGIDLVVESLRMGMESFLVLKTRAALSYAGAAQKALTMRGAGTPAGNGRGGLTFRDGQGRQFGQMPQAVAWDAQTDKTGKPRNVTEVGVSVDQGRVGFTVDKAWLNDPARAFPITIDPAGGGITASSDTFVNSGSPNSSYGTDQELEIGTQNSGAAKRLAYVNFGVGNLKGSRITYANIKLWATYSASGCTAGTWALFGAASLASDSTTYNGRPNLVDGYRNQIDRDGVNSVSVPFGGSADASSGGCTDKWVDSDATAFFQWAADRPGTDVSAVLRPYWDDTNLYYKRFYSLNHGTQPHALIDYFFPPTLSNFLTVPRTAPTEACTTTNPPSIGTAAPQLTVQVDQNERLVSNVDFQWWDAATPATVNTVTVANAASGSTVTTPSGAITLTAGHTYQWRARATGLGGPAGWSTPCGFLADPQPPPVAGCQNGLAGAADFNGDGVRDYVIADPQAPVGTKDAAGVVSIVNGATNTVSTLDQDLAEVPGSAEVRGRFGYATAIYDANQDGCADLAVAAPYIDGGGPGDSGAVYVLYGSPAGLGKAVAATVYEQGVGLTPGTRSAADLFGYALAAGKTAAGKPFLIIGEPGGDVGNPDSGTYTYLSWPYRLIIDAGNYGLANSTDDRFGYAIAADANHFAVSRPGKIAFGGKVCVFTHTVTAGIPTLFGCVDQDVTGVTDSIEAGDGFGTSLSMVPYRAPGQPAGTDSILAVGAPGEDLGGVPDAGIVHQFRLTGTNTITELAAVSEATSGMGTTPAPGDLFGQKVQLVNTDPSVPASPATLQIAVGVPGRDSPSALDAGAVHVLAAGQATVTGHRTLTRGTGLPNSPHTREFLGMALGGSGGDLLLAAPYGTDQAVYAISWSGLAAGSVTITHTWTPPVAGSGPGQPTPGASGYWPLNEGSGTTAADASGNGRSLTLDPTMGWTASGYQGSSFYQSTYGHGAETSSAVVDTTQSFTVEAWAKPYAAASAPVSFATDVGTAFALYYREGSPNWQFLAHDANTCSPGETVANGTSPVRLNTWTRLTGVYDATAHQLRLYVNGVLESTVPFAGSFGATKLLVGRTTWCFEPQDGFSGAIDEVRMWPRALTTAEIAQTPVQTTTGAAFGEQVG